MKSRRSFLTIGKQSIKGNTPGKVKMLTPDGQLVWVDPELARRLTTKTKNEEILKWSQSIHRKSQDK